jgi:fumarate hydratase class I
MSAAGLSLTETPGTQASQALNIILRTSTWRPTMKAPSARTPACRRSCAHAGGVNQIEIRKAIRAAVAEATKRGKLRPNSVDSLTGKNSGDNLGPKRR